MAYVQNRYFMIPKSVAPNYLTTGKTYPKENPECTQYYAKRTLSSEGQCGPATQSSQIRQALGYDFYPWTPIKHGRGKNENGEYVAQFDSCLRTINTVTGEVIPCKPQKPDLSTTFSDDRWPKDMGETGSGIAGYEGCKQLCDNNEKCVAFESARPVGKTYNKVTGELESDPNSKFRCILWSGRGDYEGAAIVSQNRSYSPYSDTNKAGICWTKKCQNDMKYAVPQYAGGTVLGIRTNTVQGETQFVDRTGSGSRSVINVISTNGFPNSGTLLINSRFGPHLVTYTGKTLTSFTGCMAPSYPGSTELPAGSLVTDNTDELNSWVNTANYSAKGSWPFNDDNDTYVTTLDGRRGRDVIETELGLADWVYEQGPVGLQRKKRDAEEKYCCGWRSENGQYIEEGGLADINCQYSEWSEWSDCTCNTNKTRTRTITQQSQGNGVPCNETLFQSSTCLEKCPVNCEGTFGPLSACSKECGPGTQTKTYSVTKPAENGGTPCPYTDGQVVSVPCNKGPCSINCNYEIIYDGNCSKQCGGGIETGSYNIITPASNGGTECPTGIPQRQCNVQPCPEPGDCEYEIIYDGECSKECGTGVQTGRYNIIKQPISGGQACPTGNPTRECNTQPCPQTIDCDYEVIYDGQCSKECGGGKKSGRYNIKTQPMNGGLACPTGVPVEIDCNMQSCDVNNIEEEEKDNSLRNLAIIGGVITVLCSFFIMFMLLILK